MKKTPSYGHRFSTIDLSCSSYSWRLTHSVWNVPWERKWKVMITTNKKKEKKKNLLAPHH